LDFRILLGGFKENSILEMVRKKHKAWKHVVVCQLVIRE